MAHIFEHCLEDPRVTLFEGDVARAIAPARGRYDAILLDVDNGPGGLNRAANDDLYSAAGLAAARRALAPGGCLAVWSGGREDSFTPRLRRAGFRVAEHPVRARRSGRGARHLIWLATAP